MRIPRPFSHVDLTSPTSSPSPSPLLFCVLILLSLFSAFASAEADTTTSTLLTTTTRTSTFTITMTQDPQQQQQQRNAIVTTTVATTTLGAVATGAAGASADYTNATRFKKTLLDGSNAVRANHNASALHWNDTLAAFAEDWVKGCGFRHSNGPYGENLATNYANTSAALAAWANEAAAFDFQDPGFSKQTGHFSQLVWKGTTSVGCARKDCSASEGSADGWYVVCEYSPRGNVIGAFEGNVQAAMDGAEEGEGGNSAGSGGGQSGNGRCGKVSAENGCIEAHKNGAVARGAVWGLKWSTLLVVGSAGWAAVGW